MAVKAPALPPTVKTGIQSAGENTRATYAGPAASDAEVMSKLSASSGLDKIRAQRGAPQTEEAPPETGEEATEEAAAPETTEEASGTAPDELDLDTGMNQEAGEAEPTEATAETEAEPESESEPEPEKPGKDLRSQLKHFSAQAKTLAKEKEALTKRLSELESQVKDAPSGKAMAEQLTKREERIAELEKQLAFVDYTQSPDFLAKYQKPYESRLGEAVKELNTITKEDGSKLSQGEIESLLLSTERDAYRQIDETMSGPDARLATRLVSEVYATAREKERAITSAKAEAQDKTKQQQTQHTQFVEQYKAKRQEVQDAIKTKYPDLYVPDDKDAERKGLFEAGYKLVDAAFNGMDKLSIDQRARVEAEVYHRAGAFPALRLRALRAEKALESVKKELSKFRGSAPGRGEPSTEEGTNGNGKQPEIGSKAYIEQGLLRSMKTVRG